MKRSFRVLPARPSVEFLRKQAKKLHRACLAEDPDALRQLDESPPGRTGETSDVRRPEIRRLSLQEVQHRLAIQYGFAGWSQLCDFVVSARSAAGETEGGASAGASKSDDLVNRRLSQYLGAPVRAPHDLEAAYRPEALRTFMTRLLAHRDYHLVDLRIDDTEFPPLVAGVVNGAVKQLELKSLLAVDEPEQHYVFGGAVSSRLADGQFYFALNVIPTHVITRQPDADRIFKRLWTRSEVFYSELVSAHGLGLSGPTGS